MTTATLQEAGERSTADTVALCIISGKIPGKGWQVNLGM
jgi:hypothetical protein